MRGKKGRPFYMEKRFGMFGENYRQIEQEIIKIFGEKIREPLRICVRDLNPEVFGEQGRLRQFLCKQERGKVRIIYSEDTANISKFLEQDFSVARLQSRKRIFSEFLVCESPLLLVTYKRDNYLIQRNPSVIAVDSYIGRFDNLGV